MKKTKKILLSMALVGGLATVASAVIAHQYDGDHRSRQIERLTDKLDLNVQQAEQVAQLFSTLKGQRPSRDVMQQMRKEHQDNLKQVMMAPQFDEQAVTEQVERRTKKFQQVTISKMKIQHQIYHLLDTEQQIKYLKIITHRMGNKHHRKH